MCPYFICGIVQKRGMHQIVTPREVMKITEQEAPEGKIQTQTQTYKTEAAVVSYPPSGGAIKKLTGFILGNQAGSKCNRDLSMTI